MTWTYSGNPQDTPRDLVRFLLGDVKEHEHSLNDEELDYLISLHTVGAVTNAHHAASEAAMMLRNRYIGLSSTMKRVGDLTLETHYAEQAAGYGALAQQLLAGRTAFTIGKPQFWDTSGNIFGVGMTDHTPVNPRLL